MQVRVTAWRGRRGWPGVIAIAAGLGMMGASFIPLAPSTGFLPTATDALDPPAALLAVVPCWSRPCPSSWVAWCCRPTWSCSPTMWGTGLLAPRTAGTTTWWRLSRRSRSPGPRARFSISVTPRAGCSRAGCSPSWDRRCGRRSHATPGARCGHEASLTKLGDHSDEVVQVYFATIRLSALPSVVDRVRSPPGSISAGVWSA